MRAMLHPRNAGVVFFAIIPALVAACAHDDRTPAASTGATSTSAAKAAAADNFTCTQVMGVSVTGDWFNAGFENAVDNARWQVKWRKHAFIEFWADPDNEIWLVPVQSGCASNSNNP